MAAPAAPLFDLQSLAFHDGPGIRSIAFLKGCPLRCAWCCNPEGQSALPELRWHRARCRGCLSCRGSCPAGVTVADGSPRFPRQACARCRDRACLPSCPAGALELAGRVIDADELPGELPASLPAEAAALLVGLGLEVSIER